MPCEADSLSCRPRNSDYYRALCMRPRSSVCSTARWQIASSCPTRRGQRSVSRDRLGHESTWGSLLACAMACFLQLEASARRLRAKDACPRAVPGSPGRAESLIPVAEWPVEGCKTAVTFRTMHKLLASTRAKLELSGACVSISPSPLLRIATAHVADAYDAAWHRTWTTPLLLFLP